MPKNDPYSLDLEFVAIDQETAYEIGLHVLRSIQEVLSGPRTGRWYPAPGNILYDPLTPKNKRAEKFHLRYTGTDDRNEIQGAAYQASAPGEPPASRTGRLRQSFIMTVSQNEEGHWKTNITTKVTYADDLEYGDEKVEPRPFVHPAIRKAYPKIIQLQSTAIMHRLARGTL